MREFTQVLPPELWMEIITLLGNKDISSLILAARCFVRIGQPLLFSNITFSSSRMIPSKRAYERLEFLTTEKISKIVKSVYLKDEIGNLFYRVAEKTQLTAREIVFNKIIETLPHFVNLRSFFGHQIKLTQEHVQTLCSLPSLVTLVLEKCSTRTYPVEDWNFTNPSPPLCGKLQKFILEISPYYRSTCHWWPPLLSSSSTRHVGLSTPDESDLFVKFLCEPDSHTMTFLHTMNLNEIQITAGQLVTVLSHCPSLRTFSLLYCPSEFLGCFEHELSKTPLAAPLLESFCGTYIIACSLARYRSLQSIDVTKDYPFITLEQTSSLFDALYEGSRSTLRTFSFNAETITNTLLVSFFTKFPQLSGGRIRVDEDRFTNSDSVLFLLLKLDLPSGLQYIDISDDSAHATFQDLARKHPFVAARLERNYPRIHTVSIQTKTVNVKWKPGESHQLSARRSYYESDSDSSSL
ncbi:hypothetical protein C8Q75DRAFT_803094 [Abortiporus biennis]|nr:hypothetical protein C8Q75DRAFT_803094 [Abortiporus biennis]